MSLPMIGLGPSIYARAESWCLGEIFWLPPLRLYTAVRCCREALKKGELPLYFLDIHYLIAETSIYLLSINSIYFLLTAD